MRFERPSFMDSLRRAEVYPSFATVRASVIAHEARRTKFFAPPGSAKLEGAILLALMLCGVWQASRTPELHESRTSALAATSILPSISMMQIKSVEQAGRPSAVKAKQTTAGTLVAWDRHDERRAPESPAPPSIRFAAKPAAEIPATPSRPATPVPSIASLVSNDCPPPQWSAFASGGYSIPPSNTLQNAASLAGSVGLRYRLSGGSFLVVSARRNAFFVQHSALSTAFRDSAASLDGHSYQVTFGAISTNATATVNSFSSLNAGYRFESGPDERFSPFAEVLFGGSTQGMLASESAGIEYQFFSPFLLDVSARMDQLIAPKSAPEQAFGLDFTIGYRW
jgi:hypothetical protein